MSALAPGQALSDCRILRPLPAGGMGEVYQAEDTKPGRQVALKVLAHESVGDAATPECLKRPLRITSREASDGPAEPSSLAPEVRLRASRRYGATTFAGVRGRLGRRAAARI
jgi:serine/threonine protein kinase